MPGRFNNKVMDKSNGYERIATFFIKARGQGANGIGASSVRHWVNTLTPDAAVLDLGCGTGIPITKILIDAGMNVYGIDASPTLVEAFRLNFPNTPVACEAVEESLFFNQKFDAIIAWGLLFLLPTEVQGIVIQKAANALQVGGKLLFTAPGKKGEWSDILTGQNSISLGAEKYRALLRASGLSLIEEFEDEGENHYYHAVKV
jgi:2-polyprenyl-3-methyl-5-hydroxy-6-metoxy-1,4-benzoquinol methylase